MRIALLGLTGFGSSVLRALEAAGYRPGLVLTRAEPGPYPYYPELDLAAEAGSLGIPVATGPDSFARLIAFAPELCWVATYHRIVPSEALGRLPLALNLHASLLPRYRGPSPCFWAIRNGERSSGVTAHRLTSGVDGGGIYYQEEIPIAADETQGSLRRKLAELSGRIAVEATRAFERGSLPDPRPQDESLATRFPRPGKRELRLDPEMSAEDASRLLRARDPFPGEPDALA